MKSINLTKNGQTVNITESGDAIVDGRKYKVDVDFATGKIELTYMCEEDGTLSANIDFEKISLFANKKTTPNTSVGNKPRIFNGSMYLENENDCYRCITQTESNYVRNIIHSHCIVTDIEKMVTMADEIIYIISTEFKTKERAELSVKFKDEDNTTISNYFTIAISQGEILVHQTVISSVVNKMISYVLSKIKIECNISIGHFEFYSKSYLNFYGFNVDLFEDIADISIISNNIEDIGVFLQLMRYAKSATSININSTKYGNARYFEDDGVKVFEYIKSSISYEQREYILFLFKTIKSILSIGSLQAVELKDEDGVVTSSYFVDNVDVSSRKTIEMYSAFGYAEKEYFEKVTHSNIYAVDYCVSGYIGELDDEISKHENINAFEIGYAEVEYTEQFEDIIKDKSNKFFIDYPLPALDYFSNGIDELRINGEKITEYEEDIDADIDGKIQRNKLPYVPSLIEQAKNGLKIIKTVREITAHEFLIFLTAGVTKIDSSNVKYVAGASFVGDYNLYNAGFPHVNAPKCSFIYKIKLDTSKLLLRGGYFNHLENIEEIDGIQTKELSFIDGTVKDLPSFEYLLPHSVAESGKRMHIYLASFLYEFSDMKISPFISYENENIEDKKYYYNFPRYIDNVFLDDYLAPMLPLDKSRIEAMIEAMKLFEEIGNFESRKYNETYAHISLYDINLVESIWDGSVVYHVKTTPEIIGPNNHTYPNSDDYIMHSFFTPNNNASEKIYMEIKTIFEVIGTVQIKKVNGLYELVVDGTMTPVKAIKYEYEYIYGVPSQNVSGYYKVTTIEVPDFYDKYPHDGIGIPSNEVEYKLVKNADGSVTITWVNNSEIKPLFFQLNNKKIKIGS